MTPSPKDRLYLQRFLIVILAFVLLFLFVVVIPLLLIVLFLFVFFLFPDQYLSPPPGAQDDALNSWGTLRA